MEDLEFEFYSFIFCLLAVECQFREMKQFLGGMVMMAAQQCECA